VPVVFSNEFLLENYVQAIISSELIKWNVNLVSNIKM
jgi:hypothetical protein